MLKMKPLLSCAAALGLVGSIAAGAATQAMAEFPENTIRIVVPWRAGGGTDSIARALATPMEELAGQSVLVENVTGGAGNAGMLAVKNADADGYTMVLNGSSDITAPIVFRDAPFSLDDYTCVGGVYDTPVWIVANKEQGFETFADFVTAAKAAPGELTLGVTALNAPDDVFAKAITKAQGIDVRIIPFDGGAPLKKALIGNQVNAGVLIAPVMLGEVQGGIANVLVAGGSMKAITYEPLQSLQTGADYGVTSDITLVRGVFLPKGVPADVAAKVEELVGKAAQSDSFVEFGKGFGFAPIWMPGEQYCDFMKQEDAVYRAMK